MTAAAVTAEARDNALPPHVRTAFGVAQVVPRPVLWAGRRAWHCGEVLIRPVADNAVAAWSAGVLDGLRVGPHSELPGRPLTPEDLGRRA